MRSDVGDKSQCEDVYETQSKQQTQQQTALIADRLSFLKLQQSAMYVLCNIALMGGINPTFQKKKKEKKNAFECVFPLITKYINLCHNKQCILNSHANLMKHG